MPSNFVSVVVNANGLPFTFHLTRETMNLGLESHADYFQFHGSSLRDNGGGKNGDAIVESWWEVIKTSPEGATEDDLCHYLLALAALRLPTSRAIQHVYYSGYLSPGAERDQTLDDQTFTRIDQVARSGQLNLIQEEMESVLFIKQPDAKSRIAFDEAFQIWIGCGYELAVTKGEPGIETWLSDLSKRIRNYTRRGDAKHHANGTGTRVREFTQYFIYEAHCALQLCAASAWHLIYPELQSRFNVDQTSLLFMGFMHALHQPVVDNESNVLRRGALCGQVLSLHPVGRWLLGRPEHLLAIGKWITRPQYPQMCQSGNVAGVGEYQQVVAAVLAAAHEYKSAVDQYEDKRSRGSIVTDAAQTDIDGLQQDGALLFEALAADPAVRCERCHGMPTYVRMDPPPCSAPEHMTVVFHCPVCNTERTHSFTMAQAEQLLADAA